MKEMSLFDKISEHITHTVIEMSLFEKINQHIAHTASSPADAQNWFGHVVTQVQKNNIYSYENQSQMACHTC